MNQKINTVVIGTTGSGKSMAAARSVIESRDEATAIFDPHKQSLGETVLSHAGGNILYDRLSDMEHALGYEMLAPSTHPNLDYRQLENQQRAEAFVAILLRRRNAEGMASTPLMEEWTLSAITLILFQSHRKSLSALPFAFMPGTDGFNALVRDCTLPDIRHKFQQLEKLNPRALRAEVGSAARLINAVFRSPAFTRRCRGSFDLAAFLQGRGTLILERGDCIGDDVMRTIMGAVVLLIIEHARRRPHPYPPLRVRIDEATNANLVGGPELRGIAETRKNGLFWDFYVQNLDFPGGPDAVLQNCRRHEWYACPHYDLARKGAADILAGLPPSEASRAERLEQLTHELMTLRPGWRWLRDPSGSRKEYVPLLEHPYPDWPGLREAKLQEKIRCIYERTEYRVPVEPTSESSSKPETPPSRKSRDDSSPASRLKRRGKKPADGSAKNDDEDAPA